ncbi:MAG: ankyrin repeat domain-containing protein [Akkermansiaceae bacterium]|nr:ankyrin repeat domain-containing protein [Akkermansiaceae bacterium]
MSSCRQSPTIENGASGQALLDAVKLGDNHRVALLLQEGAYMEVRDKKGDTPLLYAVKTGNLQVAGMLLKLDVDRHARSGNGRGALELALDSGNKDMVLCLLNGGVSPDEVGHDNNPLLLKAVKFRGMDTIKLLLDSGVNPSAAGKDGRTALHIAAEDGLMQCMDILLEAGADPDIRDDNGVTPLWSAAHARGPVERWRGMKRLLTAGVDVNVPGSNKESLLGEMVRRNLFKEAVELINYGATVDEATDGNPSPIEVAAEAGNDAMIAMLLSRGADGSNIIGEALDNGDIEMLRLLLEAGIRPENWRDQESNAVDGIIASCVRKGQLQLAGLCLQYGADPLARGKEGQRPLHMAVAMRDAAMVSLLLEFGADPNTYFGRPVSQSFLELTEKESMRWFLKNERRVTPLMMATNNGDLAIMSTLIEHDAKKYVYTGKHHLYPVNFASRRGDIKAMQVILGQDPEKEIHHAVLDLSEQRVRLFNAKQEVIFSSRVSTGKSGFRTPKGTFVITDKHKSHSSTIYGSSMPYFQRLSCSAFGFHAGYCPGYPASHGCIRMPHSAAKKLFGLTPVGTRVVIQP